MIYEPRCEKTGLQGGGFPTRPHTNLAVQPQKMARGFKFGIWEAEGLYYLCSENKDADHVRGYREADLRLCFRICKNPVFSRRSSYHSIDMKMIKKLDNMSQNIIIMTLSMISGVIFRLNACIID